MDQFSYVKRGYNPEEVNKYISTLEQVIKSYKEKDNAIKNAIISAQVAADNVVRNAHMQAHEYKKKISQQLIQVSAAIDAERMRLQAFHDVYSGLMRKYLFEIETADMFEMSRRLDDMEKLVNDLLEMEVPPVESGPPLIPGGESTPVAESVTAEPVFAPEPGQPAGTPSNNTQEIKFEYKQDTPYDAEPVTTFTDGEMEAPPVAPPPRDM